APAATRSCSRGSWRGARPRHGSSGCARRPARARSCHRASTTRRPAETSPVHVRGENVYDRLVANMEHRKYMKVLRLDEAELRSRRAFFEIDDRDLARLASLR